MISNRKFLIYIIFLYLTICVTFSYPIFILFDSIQHSIGNDILIILTILLSPILLIYCIILIAMISSVIFNILLTILSPFFILYIILNFYPWIFHFNLVKKLFQEMNSAFQME